MPRPLSCFAWLAFLTLAAGLAARPAQAQVQYPLPGTPEQPVALLAVGRAQYLVTEGGVYRRVGRRLVPQYRSPAPILSALATDSALWLGTQRGGWRWHVGTGAARPLALPGAATEAPITALVRAPGGEVWVGAGGYGAYRGRTTFEAVLRVPGLTAGLATADSAVWLGTNLGLHRYHRGQWTRYNEEGVANHEIPDNLVDKLLPDHAGNTWVVMSNAICALPAQAGAAELPSTTFLGRPGNELYAVAYLPGTGRLFATGMGLLLLPTPAPGEFASFEPTTDKVAPKNLLAVLPLPGPAPRLAQLDGRRRLWLASAQGLQVYSRRQWQQLARAATPAAAASAQGASQP